MSQDKSKPNYQILAETIMDSFPQGKILKFSEIRRIVKQKTSMADGSIMPYDYCSNHQNKDPHSGEYYIFEKMPGRGLYKVLSHKVIKRSCSLD